MKKILCYELYVYDWERKVYFQGSWMYKRNLKKFVKRKFPGYILNVDYFIKKRYF